MISTRSGLRRKTPLIDFHHHSAAMADTNTLQQLQNHITEMEQRHEEELTKLKVDYDQLEARVRRPQGDEQSIHTLPERNQGESHPQRTGNTAEDLSLFHMHAPAAQTVRRHPFVDHIMEADIPLGWKPLNLKKYDGTTFPDKHLDAFLI
ncbi:hypothetical protein JHK87_053239 [Glycine soja]|nr:hypothetical protein JHK87_053239 [Glycine soja]